MTLSEDTHPIVVVPLDMEGACALGDLCGYMLVGTRAGQLLVLGPPGINKLVGLESPVRVPAFIEQCLVAIAPEVTFVPCDADGEVAPYTEYEAIVPMILRVAGALVRVGFGPRSGRWAVWDG